MNKLQWLPILVKMWQWLQTNLKTRATFSNRCTQALALFDLIKLNRALSMRTLASHARWCKGDLKEKPSTPPEARENTWEQITVFFSFAPNWSREWCNFPGPAKTCSRALFKECCKTKPKLSQWPIRRKENTLKEPMKTQSKNRGWPRFNRF